MIRGKGLGLSATDDIDEQITLALEFLSFHANSCKLSRGKIDASVILTFPSLQRPASSRRSTYHSYRVDATILAALQNHPGLFV